ncbi:MAG: beta-ketoacyl-[acyl-carrier-protein] synthase family protein [Planctomycetes bacterium]|nr:beta-ketoacyl-[acyl-carrier-protein] synthase family protein [Planctomycetota bacterium]
MRTPKMDAGELHSQPGIVITGMGLATNLGRDVNTTWAGIRAGRIGLGPMSEMESPLPPSSVGGQAMDLPAQYSPELPREARYLRWVIEQALKEASASYKPDRCATILGTTLHGIRAGGRFLRSDDPGELRNFLANSVIRLATGGLGLGGRCATTCSACSSSLGAIALGVTMLQTGSADLVVAGGYDAVSEYAWAGFNSLRLVTNDGVKPFSRHRRGMMLAEGYAVVVLEREADAAARGAKPLVRVRGWGESADAHHLTQPDPKGQGAARAMRDALSRAGLQASEIGMIAAHATATPDNDAAEYAALRSVFGESLESIPVVGFKSYLGHTLGGAGAVELVLSACALRSDWIPPCATVRQEDVEFEGLRVTPPSGTAGRISYTLNTSLGFGGANTCVILGHAEEVAQVRSYPALPPPQAWITGIGVLLPGITGVPALVEALDGPETLIVPRSAAACISDDQLAQVLNVRRVRRLSTCVKLMLASVSMAIKHAGLENNTERLEKACAILASTHGSSGFCSEYYTQIVREGVLGANPVLFAEGVPNAAAAHVSTNFGIRGACQTIIGSRTAGLDALGLAAMRIQAGAAQTILVGAAEETHANVDRAYRHFNLCEEAAAGRGFFTTPGAVALVVESSASAMARGVRPLARLGGSVAVSGTAGKSTDVGCAAECDAPTRALRLIGADGAVLGSDNRSWIDRAEENAVNAHPGATLVHSLHDRTGDLFAAGSLLAIVRALAQGSHDAMTALCTDFAGVASAMRVFRSGQVITTGPDA